MSAPAVTRALFTPQPMTQWDFANAVKANDYRDTLSGWGLACKIIGSVGTAIAAIKFTKLVFGAAVLSPAFGILAITSIALLCLGIYLSKVAAKHIEGLDVNQMAVDKLIESFDKLTIYKSEDELNQALATNVDTMHNLPEKALEEVRSLTFIATPLYRPTKEIQPCFRIMNRSLTMEQMQALLDKAYEKGIILEFNQFKHFRIVGEEEPTYLTIPESDNYTIPASVVSKTTLKDMQQGFEIALTFLERRLQERQKPKKTAPFDYKFINTQLEALGFKWETKDGMKTLKPNLYMLDDQTVMVRGNFSEIDPTPAFKRLHPYVTSFQMPFTGVSSVRATDEINGQTKTFFATMDWQKYVDHLNQLTNNKLKDISKNEIDDTYQIWQDKRRDSISFKESMEDMNEDHKRIAEIKKKSQPAEG